MNLKAYKKKHLRVIIMKENKGKKQIKTDEWNEISRNREGDKTKEDDKDWNKKNDEDEEIGENKNDFHEEDYDT